MSDALTRYLDCIAACNACAVACQHCAASCLQEPDVKAMVRCIALDMDCAQLCEVSVALMAGASEFAPALCRVCAQACRACAEECARHDMDHCQQCAEACRRCAEACEQMAAA
ncbi:four-helix bundle copper-binding protein [Ramlibacter sp.]|uniref:four-helix bundle copper-binding protein n=1 Tax=Ramlibacter sp. TaxID=1917967 RepID=UPI002D2A9C07|nr:four-helix bundle copper-binding protein [Ramlibacter sp.]HYD77331.1 four-helix bundle copper-binding protein [Ramlibacter sp.]